jgi:hypothetical protein
MTTKLTRFSDAYATMTVAFYQPLTIQWVSGWTLAVAADLMAARVVKARSIDLPTALSTAAALKVARAGRLPDAIPGVSAGAPCHHRGQSMSRATHLEGE